MRRDGLWQRLRGRSEGSWLRRAEAGMTLIEIMVVVAIIGLVLGTVGVVAFNKWKKAQVTNAKQVVSNVKQAFEHYALENPGERCPKELKDLVSSKQLQKDPVDPWGQPLTFKCPGEQDADGVDVSSKGPDRKEGTEDDINSWEL